MKRLAPLALIALAFAVAPVALADGTTPPAPTPPAATTPAAGGQQQAGHPFARMRLEILRLRVQLVHLRYRIACHDPSSARCTQFTQALVNRLTKLDGAVQAKIDALKQCGPASTDARCRNADRKIALLTKVDQRLQQVIQRLGSPSAPSPAASTSDSSLDQAASTLGQLAGANG